MKLTEHQLTAIMSFRTETQLARRYWDEHLANGLLMSETAGVTVDDVAKRLIDCGFQPPPMSWPVAGAVMIEPTESETKSELDRFCDAMLAIREEARAIEDGRMDKTNNPLKNAPHTVEDLIGEWNRPYSREEACFPAGARSEERRVGEAG